MLSRDGRNAHSKAQKALRPTHMQTRKQAYHQVPNTATSKVSNVFKLSNRVTIHRGRMYTSKEDMRDSGLIYPHISKKNLIYSRTIYFKERQRDDVINAHFKACFEESYGATMEEERQAFNEQLLENIEAHPQQLLLRSFSNAKCKDIDQLRQAVYSCYKKPIVQHGF